eukprot:5533494-Prymnesium_polylepis.1
MCRSEFNTFHGTSRVGDTREISCPPTRRTSRSHPESGDDGLRSPRRAPGRHGHRVASRQKIYHLTAGPGAKDEEGTRFL